MPLMAEVVWFFSGDKLAFAGGMNFGSETIALAPRSALGVITKGAREPRVAAVLVFFTAGDGDGATAILMASSGLSL